MSANFILQVDVIRLSETYNLFLKTHNTIKYNQKYQNKKFG